MSDFRSTKATQSRGSKFASTVLVFTVPLLLLAIIGMVGGSFGIGTVEITLLLVIWAAGLAWVWRPRRG